MVIDTSVLVAVLFGEPEAVRLAEAIAQDSIRLISTASVLEASLVVESELGEAGGRELDLLLLKAAIETVPFNAEQLAIARDAWRRYGKGRHPAGLDYGDCFSYALSQVTGEALLCKGGDFSQTDVAVCGAA
jgi:ribonuclease VapC